MKKRINKPVRMTLAHINDTHSYFEPQSLQLSLDIEGQRITPYVSTGGFARIATRANQLKEQALNEGREFMFLHGGDCFQGTLYFSLFKGEANAEMLNALQLDAMVIGNHELDMGNEPVAEFLSQINFPLLAGNWDISDEAEDKPQRLKDKPNLFAYNRQKKSADWIVHYADKEPVAIFGLSIDKMADIANVDEDTPFLSSIETAKRTVNAIKAQGINKIILLSHLGVDVDQELAQQVDGIGLIIGGHSHTMMGDFSSIGMGKSVEYGIKVNGTHIVQAGLYAQGMGHCDIDFDKDGRVVAFNGQNEFLLGRRLCLDASLQQAHQDDIHHKASEFLKQHKQVVICKKDPALQMLLEEKYIPRVRELQKKTIGDVPRTLRHIRVPDHQGGSDIAPLVAESFAHMMTEQGYEVDFAIHNAGGVRTSLISGPITVADIAGKLLPFAVPIGVYRVKGKHIAHTLEGAINNATNNGVIGTGSGSYPYAYNLDFIYKADNPPGRRVLNLKIYRAGEGCWVDIEPETLYAGTSSAYTMKGKEGYDSLALMQGKGIVTQFSMADCFIDFVTHFPERLSLCETATDQIG